MDVSEEGYFITYQKDKVIEWCGDLKLETEIKFQEDNYRTRNRIFVITTKKHTTNIYLAEFNPLSKRKKISKLGILTELEDSYKVDTSYSIVYQDVPSVDYKYLSINHNQCKNPQIEFMHDLSLKDKEMELLAKKYIEEGVLGMSFNSNVSHKTYIGSPKQIVGLMIRDNLYKAGLEAINIIGHKAQFKKQLDDIRNIHWWYDSRGEVPKPIQQMYSELLFLKDMEFFTLRMSGSSHLQGVYNLLGGMLDDGIHLEAEKKFATWVQTTINNLESVSDKKPEDVNWREILNFENGIYEEYIRVRDAVEAYKKNNFSSEKYKALYEIETK